jgi:hypothetical protein
MTALDDGGCVNCGILDVPMNVEGYCQGCTCLNCGMGGTMNEVGWCDGCENVLVAYYPSTSLCFPEVVKT